MWKLCLTSTSVTRFIPLARFYHNIGLSPPFRRTNIVMKKRAEIKSCDEDGWSGTSSRLWASNMNLVCSLIYPAAITVIDWIGRDIKEHLEADF